MKKMNVALSRLVIMMVLIVVHWTRSHAVISRYISGEIGPRVLYLGEYTFYNGGSIQFDFEIGMRFSRDNRFNSRVVSMDNRQWKSLGSRTLLYLVACSATEVAFLASYENHLVPHDMPAYCALNNQTIGDRCLSIPLTDSDFNATTGEYYVKQSVFRALDARETSFNNISANATNTSPNLLFYLDACETIGGNYGVLRSCLGEDESLAAPATTGPTEPPNELDLEPDPSCFHCAMLDQQLGLASHDNNTANCIDPPYLSGVPITIRFDAQLCDGTGYCLGNEYTQQHDHSNFWRLALKCFYVLYSLGWVCFCSIWFFQLRRSRQRHIHIIDLQKRMRLIPLAQFVYSVLVLLELFVRVKFLLYGIYMAKFFALALASEVLLLIAKGWQITRPVLHAKDFHWIQSISIIWAFCFVILEYNLADQSVFLAAWILTWCCIVFSISYYSSYNMNMLEFQLRLVRQIGIEPRTTPVHTKYTLFCRYRMILATYLVVSCIVSLGSFVLYRNTDDANELVVMLDETLKFILYTALGHTFRCREFHHLFQPLAGPGQVLGLPTPLVGEPPTSPNEEGPARIHPIASSPSPSSTTSPAGNGTNPSPTASKKKTSVVFVMSPNQEGLALGTSFAPINSRDTPKPVCANESKQ